MSVRKLGCCHKSEVLAAFTAGFFIMATSNIANRTKKTAFSVSFFVYLNFKELLLAIIWSFLLSVVGNSGVAALEGSKSIKIRQCNDNLLKSGRSSGGRYLVVSLYMRDVLLARTVSYQLRTGNTS